MSGFLPEDYVRNEKADEPWKRSDTDKMLDEFFAGASPSRLAAVLRRNPKAIKRQLEQFFYNEDKRCDRYEPKLRISRKGKRWTPNEVLFRKQAAKRGVSAENTAKVLARAINECGGLLFELEGQEKQAPKAVAPTMDLIWAYHYLFHRCSKKVVTDQAYDDLVKEEIEYGGGTNLFKQIKEQDDYPGRIRCLAHYLLLTSLEKQRDDARRL